MKYSVIVKVEKICECKGLDDACPKCDENGIVSSQDTHIIDRSKFMRILEILREAKEHL